MTIIASTQDHLSSFQTKSAKGNPDFILLNRLAIPYISNWQVHDTNSASDRNYISVDISLNLTTNKSNRLNTKNNLQRHYKFKQLIKRHRQDLALKFERIQNTEDFTILFQETIQNTALKKEKKNIG